MTDSYYGRPILKEPAWKVPDVPAYLFLGGLAGASAAMAAMADATGRASLRRSGRLVAAGAATASVGALVHDLGRPARFLNMLRVFKPTSPLSVGSWILAPFSGLATAAAGSEVTGWLPGVGRLAGIGAGVLGPAMCTYTSVLLADTAVPAWHDSYPELPFVFGGSAMTSAAGVAMLAAAPQDRAPARKIGWIGTAMEVAAGLRMERGHGIVSEPYARSGLLKAGRGLTLLGAGLSVFARRSRIAAAVAGSAYLAGGVCTRFGVFNAGVESSRDPKYVVVPQKLNRQTSKTR
ncbi:NrfD/PsrC family molybdoenzyme membrane anchor subunit [Fodinicola acaciae]|uniref:NrfD/PsrC family molybdoenzyme membrane anchor subunit n=1 Tax=Fodinicola acaciae TaxID=2681555 RepID=UPI0013D12D77|nr:NrfD/PsrC family molybdoenzyme membrane anchor subunit [Fodinicola acaciae]